MSSKSITGGDFNQFPGSLRGCGDNMTRRCGGPSDIHIEEEEHTQVSCESVHIHCF